MNRYISCAAAAAVAAIVAGGAVAEDADHTLTIASWAPPTHGTNAIMWPRLTALIEEVTDGRVTAEVKYNLAPPPAMMDLILDGAADMTWIFHGYTPGRFVATKLIELPGYTGGAEAASVAYWRVHEAHLAALDEHRGTKLVALATHGPGQFHSNARISSLDEMEGMKTRLGGGLMSDVGAELGLVGIQVPAPKVYETLASGAADAVMMPLETRKGFKLTEVARNVYEMPGGFYRGSFAVLMNQDKFDSLPHDIQHALEDHVFGETASRLFGAVWEEIDAAGRAVTMETEDNEIVVASDADVAAYAEISQRLIDKVLAELTAKGVDAAAAHGMVQEEMSAN